MKKSYAYKDAQILESFQQLLRSNEFQFEDDDFLTTLFFGRVFRGDIADYVIAHIADRRGCAKTLTFDQAAAQNIPGMELLA